MTPDFIELLMIGLPVGAFLYTLIGILMLWVTDKSDNDGIKFVICMSCSAIICGIVEFIIAHLYANQYEAYKFYEFLAKIALVPTAGNVLALILLIRKYKSNKKAQK